MLPRLSLVFLKRLQTRLRLLLDFVVFLLLGVLGDTRRTWSVGVFGVLGALVVSWLLHELIVFLMRDTWCVILDACCLMLRA